MSWKRRAGEMLLAGIFLDGGYHAATDPGERVAAAARLGFPEPELVVRLNGAAMVLGGIALLTGVHRRWAAIGLIASLLPTTYSVHAYWQYDEQEARAMHKREFLKNAAMAGGLLLCLAE